MAITSTVRCGGIEAADVGVLRLVMGGWPPPRAQSSYNSAFRLGLYILAAILLVNPVVMGTCDSKCGSDACTRIYHQQTEMADVVQDATPEYCAVLQSYSTCLRATARTCRGCINYHTTFFGINKLYERYQCTSLSSSGGVYPSLGRREPCSYKQTRGGKLDFDYCGVWGDPHVLRFDGGFETCAVRGAWPLIENPHLAVQLTNQPATTGPETIVSKLTVIIKRDSDCTPQLTYEAGNGSLPAAFVDGQGLGRGSSVILREHDPGRHVEIVLGHIKTTIEIRDQGTGGLSFSIRMPKSISRQGGSTMALCSTGCPVREHLVGPLAKRMPESLALSHCRHQGLLDIFLDSCVFDLITTGDLAFARAAKHAQEDLVNLMPKVKLSNRTEWRRPRPNAGSRSHHSMTAFLVALVVLWAVDR